MTVTNDVAEPASTIPRRAPVFANAMEPPLAMITPPAASVLLISLNKIPFIDNAALTTRPLVINVTPFPTSRSSLMLTYPPREWNWPFVLPYIAILATDFSCVAATAYPLMDSSPEVPAATMKLPVPPVMSWMVTTPFALAVSEDAPYTVMTPPFSLMYPLVDT